MIEYLQQYLNFLHIEKNLSENSISAYKTDLERYLSYLEALDIKRLNQIDAKHIRKLIQTLSELGLNNASLSRNLSAIRSFHKFLLSEDLLLKDPSEHIQGPKIRRYLPSVLSFNEIELILNQINITLSLGIRDRAMLELLYVSGLRVSELLNLPTQEVYFKEEFIRILGKGSKERLVPTSTRALDWINKYFPNSFSKISNHTVLLL